MRLWGNYRRLCLSGWLVAALFVAGANGFHLMTLENQQMVGHSPTIKALRTNLAQWESTVPAPSWRPDDSRLNALRVRHGELELESAAASWPPSNTDASPPEVPETIALPVLKGMVRSMDRRGRQTYLAVLDGRVYQTDDRVGDFVVEHVSSDGVVLGRDGRQWHLDAPKPDFSEDQGN